jgi:hypothetical protein
VIHEPRSIMYATASVEPARSTMAASDTFAIVLELGPKSCAIRNFATRANDGTNSPRAEYITVKFPKLRFDSNRSRSAITYRNKPTVRAGWPVLVTHEDETDAALRTMGALRAFIENVIFLQNPVMV